MRVHILAKELSVPSKVIITKCKAEGLDVTNHMSTLSAGLAATVREWFSEGRHETTIETADRVDLSKVRVARKKKKANAASAGHVDTQATATAVADDSCLVMEGAGDSVAVETVVKTESSSVVAGADTVEADATSIEVESAERGEAAVAGAVEDKPGLADGAVGVEAKDEKPVEGEAEPGAKKPVLPAGPQNVPAPVQLKGPRVVRYEPVEPDVRMGPRYSRPSPGGSTAPRSAPAPGVGSPAGGVNKRRGRGRVGAQDDAKNRGKAKKVSGREDANAKMSEWRNRDLLERQERISDATGRRIHARSATGRGGMRGGRASSQKTEATVQEPILMKDLCAATGVSLLQMIPILRREFDIFPTINSELSSEHAEFVALEHGITLTIIPAMTELDKLAEEFKSLEVGKESSRPPVVTFLGHVDHGKTSLMDRVREAHVVEGEDGGITQHIGAYHVNHPKAGKVTFLDTPGHAAFTAMRARGADLTDIVVLVVAADDGVMPQTIEAINHAKAAGVPVVVALNKIDLGDQNVQRIYGQLAEHGLTPTGDWGGETDVLPCSATIGQGVDKLIEHLSDLGDVLDLKADAKGRATGRVIEAETKEGVGSVVRVLVQRGTLSKGDILVCGGSFGKVRALIDDRGKRIKSAGPGMPVEIWGLDEVPVAGDPFYEVGSMQRAKSVADDARHHRANEARASSRKSRSLEEVFQRREADEVSVLNIILKADVDGSLDALRSMLGKFQNDDVKLTIRHSAVGPVNDSDVLLADASNAIIVAFRVVPAGGSKRLAEEKGVDIRQYKVIYDVTDDIKKALEGLLAPDVTEETRGTCEVREVFKVSKVGAVAGCMVTDGIVKRAHLLRLLREGTLVRDDCRIASLRRFKDDAKEVRSGLECGIRMQGFDDIKAGDVIEAYEKIETLRTL